MATVKQQVGLGLIAIPTIVGFYMEYMLTKAIPPFIVVMNVPLTILGIIVWLAGAYLILLSDE